MKLIQYIRGNRRGKEINRLEKEAMNDPFLADALDGFDRVESDDHELRINAMRAKVLSRTKSGNNRVFRYIGVAAGIVLIVGAGWYFLFDRVDSHIPENVFEQQIIEEMKMELIFADTLQDEPLIAQTERKEKKAETIVNKKQINIPAPRVDTVAPDTVDFDFAESEQFVAEVNETIPDTMDTMDESEVALNDVIVVAFGTQKKSSVVGSTKDTSVGALSIPYSDLGTQLAGKALSRRSNDTSEMQSKVIFRPKTVSNKKEYKRYLDENVVMPQSEGCKGKKGTVRLKFTVDSKGRPTNIRIKKSLCPEADKEAIRLIEQGPDWTTKDKEIEIKVRFKLRTKSNISPPR